MSEESPNEWIHLLSLTSMEEAYVVRSRLEAEGIDCLLQADDVGGLEPPLSINRGYHLRVRAKDIEQAQALVRTHL